MAGPGDDEEGAAPRTGPLSRAFWDGVEKIATASGMASPRMLFKIRRARARWEERAEERANLERGITYSHKACPACGRLVDRSAARCPYCDANVRWAPGPGIARSLGLTMPHGSVAMTLIGLNLILFAVSTFASARVFGEDTTHGVVRSLFSPDLRTLYNMGGLSALPVFEGQYWRLLTYQFLHGGALHIFFNLFALFSLGPTTEDVYGPSKTLCLYLATGVAAGVTTIGFRTLLTGRVMLLPVTIGASGAIFGLIGLLIGHATRRGGAHGAYLKSFLIRWAIYGLIMGFLIGADNAAHVGGLVSGIVFGFLVPEGEPTHAPGTVLWRFAAALAGGLTLLAFVAAAMAPHA
jgi:rhomboid protease GluP